MTQVKLDKSLAEDLITSKMRLLQQYINEILNRWNATSSKEFLEKAINDYNEMFKTDFGVDGKGFQNYYRDLANRVKNQETAG